MALKIPKSLKKSVFISCLSLILALFLLAFFSSLEPPYQSAKNVEPDTFKPVQSTQRTFLPAGLRQARATEIQAAIKSALSDSYRRVPSQPNESRHDLSRRLYASAHLILKHPKIVIMAFEGTGSFEPRMALVMQDAAHRLRQQGLMVQGQELSLQYSAFKSLAQVSVSEPNWSALATGPLEALLRDPELQTQTIWLSFPSEEFEWLSRLTRFEQVSLPQLAGFLTGQTARATAGIDRALESLKTLLSQFPEPSLPQLVVVSHSSGTRAAIKFIERAHQLKGKHGKRPEFSLVISSDPVCEADQVMGEAFSEILNYQLKMRFNRLQGWLDLLPFVALKPKPVPLPVVQHRLQPNCLYVPDQVKRFISFYQQKDTLGLRLAPQFGIHGSPVAGAMNQEIKQVGPAGHGEIAFHPTVTTRFTQELKALLR